MTCPWLTQPWAQGSGVPRTLYTITQRSIPWVHLQQESHSATAQACWLWKRLSLLQKQQQPCLSPNHHLYRKVLRHSWLCLHHPAFWLLGPHLELLLKASLPCACCVCSA